MFSKDFYPSPLHVIEEMTADINLSGKVVLEPSAGKGDIVDYCQSNGASVIACEKHPELRAIVAAKCKIIADDFLTLTSDQISHIDAIIMNPPFSADEHHIMHAFEIAPAGCVIKALCNLKTVEPDTWNRHKNRLGTIIGQYGQYVNMGNCFDDAERKTGVEIALVTLGSITPVYTRRFQTTFGIVFTSDNENEVIAMYYLIKALLIALMPSNSLAGLENVNLSGGDIRLEKLFNKVLNFNCQYETSVPSLYSSPILKNLDAHGTPVNP